MLSLSLFHLSVLILGSLFPSTSTSFYQRQWFLKLLIYLLMFSVTFMLNNLLVSTI
jgi:hypothetical protein